MKICQFGDPILRQKAKNLSVKNIKSAETQKLIKAMQALLLEKKMGVGLAAPQIGKGIALAIVCVRPTKHRPEVQPFDLTIINPKIMNTYGKKVQQWEGCISGGPLRSSLFAKVPRHKKIELQYYDEKAKPHKKTFDGLTAHIIQHEVDHLNGVLFVDKVKDTKTFITYSEYLKLARKERAGK